MANLSDQVILITGASKGIGKATALKLAAQGALVALIARSNHDLEQVKKEIVDKGGVAEIYAGSVSDEAFVNDTVKHVAGQFGKIDVMINNAGYGVFEKVENITVDQWDDIFATNTKGTFLFCKAVIPHMKDRKAGHIINIASDVAKRVFSGGSLYCASKYAQDAFSSAIRKELRPFKIKVSVVYSGLVDSYFHAEQEGDPSHDFWLKNQDMANAIQFIIEQPAHVVIDELMIHPLEQEY